MVEKAASAETRRRQLVVHGRTRTKRADFDVSVDGLADAPFHNRAAPTRSQVHRPSSGRPPLRPWFSPRSWLLRPSAFDRADQLAHLQMEKPAPFSRGDASDDLAEVPLRQTPACRGATSPVPHAASLLVGRPTRRPRPDVGPCAGMRQLGAPARQSDQLGCEASRASKTSFW